MRLLLLVTLLCLLTAAAFANTPGSHNVVLTWQDSCPTCAFNVYRGPATGVCAGKPTPYASNILTLTFEDDFVTAGTTYVYAVSAQAQNGGESACSTEAQASVSNTMGPQPTNLQITAH